MAAGTKRQRVRIEQAVETSDSQGGTTTTYALRAVVWARERQMTGAEALRQAQVTAVRPVMLEIWYRTDVQVTDRVRIGSRIVQIESLHDPDGSQAELWLTCSEVQT